MSAPRHPDDRKIRETLYGLNILDTPIEERFERITRLVCITLGVPVSLFSLIDGERQWFKSVQGMDIVENTRAESFCAYTMLGDEVMVVPDAKSDRRFASNSLVKGDPHIAFYAGCPVRAPDGRNIGSLCAIDYKSHHLTEQQKQTLRDLAGIIESELKVDQLSKSQYELIREVDTSHRQLLIDSTTRLWNRQGLLDLIKKEITAAEKNNMPLSLIKAEVDGLEKVREVYGSAAAVLLVKDVAARILSVLRPDDLPGRIEGGRFLIIRPNEIAGKFYEVADQLRLKITSEPFVVAGNELPLTMSFGILSETADSNIQAAQYMSAVEKALQKARIAGRNCTVPGSLET